MHSSRFCLSSLRADGPLFLSPKRCTDRKVKWVAKRGKVARLLFNQLLICNPCKRISHLDNWRLTKSTSNAHSTFCNGICQSQSGGNAILPACFPFHPGSRCHHCRKCLHHHSHPARSDHYWGWKKSSVTGKRCDILTAAAVFGTGTEHVVTCTGA